MKIRQLQRRLEALLPLITVEDSKTASNLLLHNLPLVIFALKYVGRKAEEVEDFLCGGWNGKPELWPRNEQGACAACGNKECAEAVEYLKALGNRI